MTDKRNSLACKSTQKQPSNGCATPEHSPLLDTFLPQLTAAVKHTATPILDLACGLGRNGLFLAQNNLPVEFADRNADSLQTIKAQIEPPSSIWPVDFEQPDSYPLADKSYAAILVFRYLHRPLFESIKQAIKPGGFIIYETFTVAQAQLGRPKNPNFLLKPGELHSLFDGWTVYHQFEGIRNGSAIAQIIAVKPERHTTTS